MTIVGSDVVFEPHDDFSGQASFVYTVRDNGLTNGVSDFKSSTATVSFAVTPINDVPSFVKGEDQNVTDGSPAQTIVGWATDLLRGPAAAVDEANQTLSFVVGTDDESLFAELPSVDAAGTLRFRPAANVRGTAVVTVRIKDSGGTASGGVDESEAKSFEIEVTKPHPMHNAAKAEDVSNDGKRVAGDALDVINFINAFGSQKVASRCGNWAGVL